MTSWDWLDGARGSGKTHRQLASLPPNALFVWCNASLEHPLAIIRHLGCTDIRIVSPSWMITGAWRGCQFSAIELDHACDLTYGLASAYLLALTRVHQ